MDNYLISICIPTYKRVEELKRCLGSIDCKNKDVEIIVSENCSGKREFVRGVVADFTDASCYKVVYNENISNLGYDRNLEKLINIATGRFVLFISDDDAFIPGALDQLIEKINQFDAAVVFSQYISTKNGAKIVGRKYNHSFKIHAGEVSAQKYLHDSILISGILFDRNIVSAYSADKFVGLNYFQVYLFLSVVLKHDCAFINVALVNVYSDGEGGFGDEESMKNNLLSNRSSIYSDMEFHKGLIKVIKAVDNENTSNIIESFSKRYALTSFVRLSLARDKGVTALEEYFVRLQGLDIELGCAPKIYFILLKFFGTRIATGFVNICKKIVELLSRNKY